MAEGIDIESIVAAQGDELTAGNMTLQRLIQHIALNDQKNIPIRNKMKVEAGNIETAGQAIIDGMASMAMVESKIIDASQEAKLAQQKMALQRYQQLGIDMNNPASDRLAKMTEALQQQQDALLASQQKIQQMDSVGFADNPIQWFINQYAIDSEKESLVRTSSVANQLAGQISQMHNMAQENVQTITAAKIAMTDNELLHAKEKAVKLAALDYGKAKMEVGNSNMRALGALLQANEQEASVMWKASALVKDQQDRDRDLKKEQLQYDMLKLQFDKMSRDEANKAALVKDMREFSINEMGTDPQRARTAPDEAVLNNKPLQDAYLHQRGLAGPQGPKSALDSIEANSTPDSIFQNTRPARWIREKLPILQQTMPAAMDKLGPNAEKAQATYFDAALIQAAQQELLGDHDNSSLYRMPTVGELRQLISVSETNLFKRYLAGAPDNTYRSFKQLIGYAVADPKLKTDGNARARLVKDINAIATTVSWYSDTAYFLKKYGLPSPVSYKEGGGYRIAPTELLAAANAQLPPAAAKKFFDLTKPGDTQLLVNLLTMQPKQSWFEKSPLNLFDPGPEDFGNELRAKDKFTGAPQPKAKTK